MKLFCVYVYNRNSFQYRSSLKSSPTFIVWLIKWCVPVQTTKLQSVHYKGHEHTFADIKMGNCLERKAKGSILCWRNKCCTFKRCRKIREHKYNYLSFSEMWDKYLFIKITESSTLRYNSQVLYQLCVVLRLRQVKSYVWSEKVVSKSTKYLFFWYMTPIVSNRDCVKFQINSFQAIRT